MKPKILLLLSVVMGIITTFLFYQYMKQVGGAHTASVHTVGVVAAKETIEKNETITASMLEMVQVPENAVQPGAIQNISDAEGKLATSMIENGEQVLAHRLASEKDESVYVSRKVHDGYRAISIGVDLDQSVSNLIEPEDVVDVIVTKTTKDQANQPVPQTVILLQGVRVLAIGRQMQTPEETKEPYKEYSDVTLEVKPEDAVNLINATEQGKIYLILERRPLMNDNN